MKSTYDPTRICFRQDSFLDSSYMFGSGCRPIINASIGTSMEHNTFEIEIAKAKVAVDAGASMITDHSICGDVIAFHKELRSNIHVPLACVPIYELSLRNEEFTDDQALDMLKEVLDRGFNILTIHATALLSDISHPITNDRVIKITSKGGRLILDRMAKTGLENPFYSQFSRILQLVKGYNAAISLAPIYRPAGVVDNSLDPNDPYWIEVSRMSTLVRQAVDAEVPIIVEGIGHAMLSLIPEYVKRAKSMCMGVPYKVLTVSTDIALGYDHISSAIASSVAVYNGADIVTAVTPSEHIALPSIRQVEEGVVAANIAIHSAKLCSTDCVEMDRRMSRSRATRRTCQGSIEDAIYPIGAERAVRKDLFDKGCSMCGSLCAFLDKEGQK